VQILIRSGAKFLTWTSPVVGAGRWRKVGVDFDSTFPRRTDLAVTADIGYACKGDTSHEHICGSFKFNLLTATGYLLHQQVQRTKIVHSAHTVCMCFVFISEQTATLAQHNVNRLGFYNRGEKRLLLGTNWVFK
jgi:hypothetical protein